ncbi:hypoxia up-regulated protein 1-like [Zophobas morio]|uniref:hypoxia up-regulated protein 1-like n=1 Tax=Zophobas morio TaxID=2755281 RepID=UPI003083E16B
MFPHHRIEKTEEGSVKFIVDDEEWTVEQLVAMLLEYAMEQGRKYAKENIRAAAICIPSFFGQSERRSMMLAARLADIEVLQLVNGMTAVAVYYGLFNQQHFEKKSQNIMFYDMGSGSTSISIVKYELGKNKGGFGNVKHPVVKIKGFGFDRHFGGSTVDVLLKDFLVGTLNNQQKSQNATITPRTLMKLFLAAQKAKEILSANNETRVSVEGVLPGVDFSTLVRRSDLSLLLSKQEERVQVAVQNAFKSAQMKIEDVDQVVMVGGAQRMPAVQETISRALLGKHLSRNINADEAAVLGAVFIAASRSSAFRVLCHVEEKLFYDVDSRFENIVEGEPFATFEKSYIIKTLFSKDSKVPSEKSQKFTKFRHDFTVDLFYGTKNFDESAINNLRFFGDGNISSVNILGVPKAIEDHKDKQFSNIKLDFVIDHSGLLFCHNATATFTLKQEKLSGSWLSNAFGGRTSKEELKTIDNVTSQDANNISKEENEGKKKNATSNSKNKKMQKQKDNSLHVELKVVHHVSEPLRPSEERVQSLRERLIMLSKKEEERLLTAEEKNELESCVYDMLEKLESEDVVKVTTSEERKALRKEAVEIRTWLEDSYEEVTHTVYTNKRKLLEDLMKPVHFRAREFQNRPIEVEKLKNLISKTESFSINDKPFIPEDIRVSAVKELTDVKAWLEAKLAEQENTPLASFPPLLSRNVAERAAKLRLLLQELSTYKPPAVFANTTTPNASPTTPVETPVPEAAAPVSRGGEGGGHTPNDTKSTTPPIKEEL